MGGASIAWLHKHNPQSTDRSCDPQPLQRTGTLIPCDRTIKICKRLQITFTCA